MRDSADASAALEDASTLPGDWYSDPAVFAAEKDRVFAPSWIPAARAADLASLGDYRSATVAGEPVLLVRNDEGIAAFANVCRHRNMTVLEGSGSCRSLQCPYHLWTYRLDGTLAAAPAMRNARGFDPADHPLRSLAVDCWGGWVLVNVDGTAVPFAEQNPGLDAIYDESWLGGLVTGAVIDGDSPFNWKVQVENFAESYHHAGVHPETLQSTYPGQESFVVAAEGEPWCSLDHVSVVDGMDPFTATVAFPHFLFSWLRPDAAVWFDMSPRAVDRTDLSIRVLVESDADPEVTTMLAEAVEAINDEDTRINERTQAGLGSRFATPGRISHLEEATWLFRRWVVDRLREA